MQFGRIPLAVALLSCCCCCALLVDAEAPINAAAAKQAPAPAVTTNKLKRDAGLSFGSGLYHGPSHKYLPPGPSHSSSYDSGFGYASALHGNGLSSSSGYDFGHADSTLESYGGHHYGGHSSHGRPHYSSSSSSGGFGGGFGGGHHHQGPKVETYIVQTSGGSGSGHGHGYHGHGPSHGPSHGTGHTYGYSHGYGQGHGSGSGSVSGAGLGYKYASHGSTGGGGGGGYLSLLGGHKPSSTYLVAGPEYSHSSHHGGSAGGRPSYAISSSHSSAGHGFSHGFGGHGLSHGPSHGHALEHGSSHGHAIEQALEQGLSHALSLGHGAVQLGGYAHQGPSSHPSLEHHLGGEETSGYSYEAPSIGFGKSPPLSSYGVPLLPGYEHQQHPQHPLPDQVQVQVLEEQEHKAEQAAEEHQTPIYALGHKGLGHFSYTASKPQALHTDVLSNGGGGGGGHHHSNDISLNELSKAPFKPSAFLGAKHETSSGSGAGYDYATPSNQYLQPPTSSGYDYQTPPQQVLYGAPGHSGDSATPIFEPEATYLPPVPTHGYH
ncbi:hornerin [Drosophila obscura]|uniref:hornerin n=1 Tax=Drosophila obscura TaxID=7282 RepID=UPI001BB28F3B|nr:hornerin [Drosophila obscura]